MVSISWQPPSRRVVGVKSCWSCETELTPLTVKGAWNPGPWHLSRLPTVFTSCHSLWIDWTVARRVICHVYVAPFAVITARYVLFLSGRRYGSLDTFFTMFFIFSLTQTYRVTHTGSHTHMVTHTGSHTHRGSHTGSHTPTYGHTHTHLLSMQLSHTGNLSVWLYHQSWCCRHPEDRFQLYWPQNYVICIPCRLCQ